MTAGSVVGIGVGVGVSRFFGAALFIPAVAGVAAMAILAKWGPERSKPFAVAGGVIIGHVAWMIAGALVLGTFSPVAIDIVLMSAGVAWLLASPSVAPAIVLLVFEVIALVVNVLQLGSPMTSVMTRGLVLHILLRVGALVALGTGYRTFRRQAQQLPAATAARVFD